MGARWAQVRAAYPAEVEWPSDARHWSGIDDVSLPIVVAKGARPLDGLPVRDGTRAMVFLGNSGVVSDLVITTADNQGLTQVLQGC